MADVTPVIKKKNRNLVKSYRYAGVLPSILKVLENVSKNKWCPILTITFLIFMWLKEMVLYKECFNFNNRKTKKIFDRKGYTGAIVMD